MAMAYLCSNLRKLDPALKVSDNPLGDLRCLIINHNLRDGSAREADQVLQAVEAMHIHCFVYAINWPKILGPEVDPRQLPNLETMARRERYRMIGRWAGHWSLASIFMAHHEDDQYETLLMRLTRGNGGRRLRGIPAAGGIPECEGIHRAYESGWHCDQARAVPYIKYKFPSKARRELMGGLQGHLSTGPTVGGGQRPDDVLVNPWVGDIADTDTLDYSYLSGSRHAPDPASGLAQLPLEDGGCRVYRPLLGFSKDRLIATCLANNIPWFEDHTNSDPTLTQRNAVRHMVNNFQLPAALQKPAVLALSAIAAARARAQDAEADRLLSRTRISEFQSRVGSLVVHFPELVVSGFGVRSTPERVRARIAQKRFIAGLVIQRICALVGPKLNPPMIASLQTAISRLFPSLVDGKQPVKPQPLKAFSVAGLLFTPIHLVPRHSRASVDVNPHTWYVSRTPYTSHRPLPECRSPYWALPKMVSGSTEYTWSKCAQWRLYDGRYWFRLTHRLPYRVVVLPYLHQHAGHFQDSLSPNDQERLDRLLQRLAPEKVRWTLPAVYLEEYLDLNNPVPRPNYPYPEEEEDVEELEETRNQRPEGPLMPVDISKVRMLSVPTLDIGLPGLADWLQVDVRHKKADQSLLMGKAFLAGTGCYVRTAPPKRETRRRRSSGGDSGGQDGCAEAQQARGEPILEVGVAGVSQQ